MTQEQLAFVNQQLAGMLEAGLPLEGALQRLCRDLRGGVLKRELEALQEDLAQGRPVAEAVRARQLPELYRRVVAVGVEGGDLPGALTLLADYYQRAHLLWTRLKGLLAYPILVLTGCALLAGFVAVVFSKISSGALGPVHILWGDMATLEKLQADLIRLWAPAFGFGGLLTVTVICVLTPPVRRALRWRLPGFREAALANLASTFHLLLDRGCALGDAVHLVERVEGDSAAGRELREWGRRIAAGEGKPAQFAAEGRAFPPLFRWILCQGGEDLAAGFKRAAEIYLARAMYRSDLMLHLALPTSVLMLGLLILVQFLPLVRLVVMQIDVLGG